MAKIRAFKGIRYNNKINDFSKILAPPYDVINEKQQQEYYDMDPNNVIRLILAKGQGNERYNNASETFKNWLEENILIQDDKPSIYPYYQEFEFEGNKFNRKGFITTVKVEDFDTKTVLPHEQTFKKHKEDRLRLTNACNSNMSQVFSVYSDEEGSVEKLIDENLSDPIIDVISNEGIRNTYWKISDEDIISKIQQLLANKSLLIADGHHRYETSINFRNQQREKFGESSGDQPYDYVMMYLSRGEGEGLIINPTHRIVKNTGFDTIDDLLLELEEQFSVEKISIENAINLKSNQISLITDDPQHTYKLTPKAKADKNYENLAVMVLHKQIFGKIINEETAGIKFSKYEDETIDDVQNGEFKLGFLLPKLNASDIFDVVLDDVKMPHKTTYFYPKILSGLVFNPLW